MALAAGTRLGAYEITGTLGAGGMGEVYRATDTKLGRDVAIKTLPSALAQDSDRLARFEREAKLLATLNHAHIAAIYGLDEHDGTQYLAMELVEGETLEQKLKGGPLPVEDALHLALQIAEALEAAHEKGVVHRDLKPANIMVTGDGQVKVLDFGLAKAFSGDPNETSAAHSPALSMAMTQQGLILGTAGYMSPEQASGQATDQRADIWAFGVVLYEMLTGLPLFSGESVPHILADVLRTEPDWNRLPKNLHSRLKLLLERCLRKRVRNRYHSIADARVDIEDVLSDPLGTAPAVKTAVEAPAWAGSVRLVAAVVMTGVVGALIGWSFWPASEPRPATRFEYALPEGQTLNSDSQGSAIAVSPDGRGFVYDTPDGLYLRSMDDLEARRISGSESHVRGLFYSPDGQSIAYFTVAGDLKRIAIVGGAPVAIADGLNGEHGASWAANGAILFGAPKGVFRVSAKGGKPELVIPAEHGEQIYGPQLLPDGDSVLFTTMTTGNRDEAQIAVQSLSTGKRTILLNGGYDAHYALGDLVYALRHSLFAVKFDARHLRVSGSAAPLAQHVTAGAFGMPTADYAVSHNGTLIFTTPPSVAAPRFQLVWVDREGREESLGLKPCQCLNPSLSPDGKRVALQVDQPDGKNTDLWVWSLSQHNRTRLTFEGGLEDAPVWTPDSKEIAYRGPGGIFLRHADGTGAREQLLQASSDVGGGPVPFAWTPDGELIFGERSSGTASIDALAVKGNRKRRVVLATNFYERRLALSPDGRWLAYQSNEEGQYEIYVRPYPNVNAGKWKVSSGGGEEPKWARDGHTPFFLGPKSLMATNVESKATFTFQTPVAVLDRGKYVLSTMAPLQYDVSPDGQRFLVLKPIKESNARVGRERIVVVENWSETLTRLVPTK